MFKTSMLAGVSAIALLAGAPTAFAQVAVTQGTLATPVQNDGAVSNTGTININGGAMGAGASAAVGATGAATVVSVSGINQALNGPAGDFGDVQQNAFNNWGSGGPATITNLGVINGGGATLGQGASVSASATGAVASVGVTGLTNGFQSFTAPAIGNITQGAVNWSPVSNSGSSINGFGDLNGAGASASVGASGAVTSVGVSFIGASNVNGSTLGNVTQAAVNDVEVAGTSVDNTNTSATVGNLFGTGASVSLRATGAAASISVSHIDTFSEGSFTVGNVVQGVRNQFQSNVSNGGVSSTVSAGDLVGAGSSASIGATGAIGSVGVSSIAGFFGGTPSFGTISQTVSNSDSTVTNQGTINAGALTGSGTSASISASGAVASVGMSSISTLILGGQPTVGTITQDVSNTINIGGANVQPNVTNTGTINLTGGITGAGASASVSAVGAGAYVSFSTIGGFGGRGP